MNNATEQLFEYTRNRRFGKYRGTVVNNNDTLNMGRLEVKVKNIMRDISFWALPCLPFAGKDMGLFMVPEVGTGVWIEFEGGELSHPIWTGCYWGDDEAPKNNNNAAPKERMIRSQTGLTISLNDKDETVTIRDKEDENTITIDVKEGTVRIKGKHKVIVEAQNVQLGSGSAAEPLVRGNKLFAYLTGLAAAATTPGPTPDLLSTKVKTV